MLRRKKILFLTHRRRQSFDMRGVDISRFAKRFKASYRYYYWWDWLITDRTIDKHDIFVFVKTFDANLARRIKERGKTVVFDPIDNFDWENRVGPNSPYIDVLIAANLDHKRFMEKKLNKRTEVIQHHHSNFKRKTKIVSEVKTIGYLGLPFQFEMRDEMKEFCAEHGLRWYEKMPVSKKVVREVRKIDLGVIYLDTELDTKKRAARKNPTATDIHLEEIVRFKPAQKFLLFLSAGIPCVSTPYESYVEVVESVLGKNHGYPFAETKEQVIELIEKLSSDHEYYEEIAIKSLQVANAYHIQMIELEYAKLFMSLD